MLFARRKDRIEVKEQPLHGICGPIVHLLFYTATTTEFASLKRRMSCLMRSYRDYLRHGALQEEYEELANAGLVASRRPERRK